MHLNEAKEVDISTVLRWTVLAATCVRAIRDRTANILE